MISKMSFWLSFGTRLKIPGIRYDKSPSGWGNSILVSRRNAPQKIVVVAVVKTH